MNIMVKCRLCIALNHEIEKPSVHLLKIRKTSQFNIRGRFGEIYEFVKLSA